MRNSYRIVLFILGMFPLMSTLAFSVPGLINYKGQLTDASGGPVAGPVDVTFTLWDAETGGTQLGAGFSDTDSVPPNSRVMAEPARHLVRPNAGDTTQVEWDL